jgi:hypothetical protein
MLSCIQGKGVIEVCECLMGVCFIGNFAIQVSRLTGDLYWTRGS